LQPAGANVSGLGASSFKAAVVIIHISRLDEPPFRLLGTDAVCVAEQSDIARIEADRKRRGVAAPKSISGSGLDLARRGKEHPNGTLTHK
jgi:hypothetical protein